MKESSGLLVRRVRAGGIASQLRIKEGDRIQSINGIRLRDEIDYRFLSATEALRIGIFDPIEGDREIRLRKEWSQGLGLEFESFPVRSCNNRCLFCFVDQMPPGLRSSLYFKDEDYRLSFLHGNYVTLTNLSEEDWKRIAEQRLSPLFISVHATELALRRYLLGNPRAPDIMAQLRRLAQAHIRTHLQVVICPGLNDGPSLERTIADLATLQPHAESLSLVPVGLTVHRAGLFPLRSMSPSEAEEIVALSRHLRRRFRKEGGRSFLHLADEIYLLARQPFPSAQSYEGFPQMENGVGMAQRFLSAFRRREKSLPKALGKDRTALLLTGEAACVVLRPVVERLNQVQGLKIDLAPLHNSLFGPPVTVAGLLSGRDFQDRLPGACAEEIWIPESALEEGGECFLDGLRLEGLREQGRVPILPMKNSISSLLRVLFPPPKELR